MTPQRLLPHTLFPHTGSTEDTEDTGLFLCAPRVLRVIFPSHREHRGHEGHRALFSVFPVPSV